MNNKLVFGMLGKLLIFEGCLLIPSLVVAFVLKDGCFLSFLLTIAAALVCGLPLYLSTRNADKDMFVREGLAIAGLSWLSLSLLGALPLVFSKQCGYIDAFFEIASGFTTTGATIFTDVSVLPKSIQLYRAFTHWIGGMGVLVLTTAILPGVGGRLAKAESSGPQFSKLLPKAGDNSKLLYMIYGALTLVLVVVLRICGMNWFDSLLHAMSTAGTGGFSNKSISIAEFDSVAVEVVTGLFMLLFSLSFALYFRFLSGEKIKSHETRVFLAICVISTLIIAINVTDLYESFLTGLRHAFFQVTSIVSTTGYSSVDFNTWPTLSKFVLVLLMLTGGCAGSTAGGLKLIRVILLVKLSGREILKSFMPRRVKTIKLDGKSVSEEMLSQIAVFFFVYIMVLFAGAAVMAIDGCDLTTAFSGSLACVSNVGPGFGKVGPLESFAFLHPLTKLFLSLEMIAGRLEFYPLIILCLPQLWRKS